MAIGALTIIIIVLGVALVLVCICTILTWWLVVKFWNQPQQMSAPHVAAQANYATPDGGFEAPAHRSTTGSEATEAGAATANIPTSREPPAYIGNKGPKPAGADGFARLSTTEPQAGPFGKNVSTESEGGGQLRPMATGAEFAPVMERTPPPTPMPLPTYSGGGLAHLSAATGAEMAPSTSTNEERGPSDYAIKTFLAQPRNRGPKPSKPSKPSRPFSRKMSSRSPRSVLYSEAALRRSVTRKSSGPSTKRGFVFINQ